VASHLLYSTATGHLLRGQAKTVWKLDSAGNWLWSFDTGGTGNYYDGAYGLAVDNSGNVYVTGYINSTSSSLEFWALWKLDSSGNIVWMVSNPDFFGVTIGADGYIYCTGRRSSASNATIWKFDSDGNLITTYDPLIYHPYPSSPGPSTTTFSIVVDGSGIMTIGHGNSRENWGGRVTRMDSSGSVIWSSGSGDEPNGISIDGSGNVWVTSSSHFGYACLEKFNSSGNSLWGGSFSSYGRDVATLGGYVYYVGNRRYESPRIVLWKLDSSGVEQWGYTAGQNEGRGVAVDSSGDVYMASSFGISKIDSAGVFVLGYSTGSVAMRIAVDASKNIYATGLRVGHGHLRRQP